MSLESSWTQAVRASAKRLWSVDLDGVLLEPPTDPKFGDATCNAPMRLAKHAVEVDAPEPLRGRADGLGPGAFQGHGGLSYDFRAVFFKRTCFASAQSPSMS